MSLIAAVVLALLLDAYFGEPEKLYARMKHPVVLMGETIGMLSARLNAGNARWLKGILTVAVLVIVGGLIGRIIAAVPDFRLLEVAIAAMLLAHKSLMSHVREVAEALQNSLIEGRAAVGKIVGRDTAEMSETHVARASIESAAENFSDGVIAPAFWFLILGLPGIIIYKLVNTADSMIGYRTEEYEEFGWGAAKLDDLMNWIPARITGGLICAVHRSRDAMMVMYEDAPLHRSPNAGWPEAALAGVLKVALAGPRSYDGSLTQDLYVNPHGRRDLDSLDILEAIEALERCWRAMVIGLGVLAVLVFLIF